MKNSIGLIRKAFSIVAVFGGLMSALVWAESNYTKYDIPYPWTIETVERWYKPQKEALDLLGLEEDFPSLEARKKAYKKFMIKNHPDRHRDELEKYRALTLDGSKALQELDSIAASRYLESYKKALEIVKSNPRAFDSSTDDWWVYATWLNQWYWSYSNPYDDYYTKKNEKPEAEPESPPPTPTAMHASPNMNETYKESQQETVKPQSSEDRKEESTELPDSHTLETLFEQLEEATDAGEASTDDSETGLMVVKEPDEQTSAKEEQKDKLTEKGSTEKEIPEAPSKEDLQKLGAAIEKITGVNDTSPVGLQSKSIYGAGIAESLQAHSTIAMTHHTSAMNTLRSAHMLSSIELEDVETGEMLASRGSVTLNKQLIKEGNVYSYGQIYGSKVSQGKMNNLSGFSSNGYGLEVGVFKQVSNQWSFGLMFGMQKTSTSLKEAMGSANSSSFSVGPFASWQDGPWHLDSALIFGMTDLDLKRQSPLSGQRYSAHTKAKEWTVYTGLGYDIDIEGTNLVLTPNIELLRVSSSIDGFKEKGDSGALKVDSQSRSYWVTRTGLKMSYLVPDMESPKEFRLGIGLEKTSQSKGSINVGFADQKAMQSLKAGSYGNQSVYYNAGYSSVLKNNQSLHFDYFGSTGEKKQTHAVSLTYEMKF